MPLELTYLNFLAVFVLVPGAAVTVGAVVRYRADRTPLDVQLGGLALIVGLALVYTVPWDNSLIAEGVWWYGDGTVATRFWEAPLGEYLFIVLQSLLVGVWTFALDGTVDATIGQSWRDRIIGAVAGGGVTAVGVLCLLGPQSTYYIGAILTWAGPVLILQWGVGWRYLVGMGRRLAVMVLVPVVYLSTIDLLAIGAGIWTISTTHTTGVTVGGLPVEEGAFFLCTSLFVVQALVLLRWVIARWE